MADYEFSETSSDLTEDEQQILARVDGGVVDTLGAPAVLGIEYACDNIAGLDELIRQPNPFAYDIRPAS